MIEGRYEYNELDKFIFDSAKVQLSHWIEELKSSGLRKANIEIELMEIIKEKLSEE